MRNSRSVTDQTVSNDNALADSRRFPGDHVCVVPQTGSQAARQSMVFLPQRLSVNIQGAILKITCFKARWLKRRRYTPTKSDLLVLSGIFIHVQRKLVQCLHKTFLGIFHFWTSKTQGEGRRGWRLPKMQVFVRTLSGRTITLEVHSSMSVWDVKDLIEEREGIPRTMQR